MDKHYVCTGDCGGVSDHAKSCDTAGCMMQGQPLKECNCTDGMHAEVMDSGMQGEADKE